MANEQTSVPLYAAAEVLTAANMNISAGTGVPVFATTVTRDAAFGGAGEKVLAEGQLCYLSASNIVQYYDGAAWATVGPATAGGLVSMPPTTVGKTGASSTATASAVGGVTFTLCETLTLNGVFTSAYSNYRIVFAGLASANPTLNMRLVAAGTPASGADYNVQLLLASSTTVSGSRTTSQTSWSACANLNVTGDNFSMDMFNPQASKVTTFHNLSYSNTSGSYLQIHGGIYTTATSFDGIQFIPTAGNFSGIVTVYGYNQ